jgi:2-haloacid dehalogenase
LKNKEIKNIIFDLGGVLIDWSPEYVYLDVFKNDRKKMQWFFDEICTFEWNENQDAGYPLAQATADKIKEFPQYAEWIEMYYGRWEEMLGDPIQGTVELLDKLVKNPNYRVVALTNWSTETFPVALKRFDFLHWFEGIVVSGAEQTRKPFAEIYQTTMDRFQLKAENSLFIDDNARNIEAAQKLGIQTVHFSNPNQLRNELTEKNVFI